MLVVRTADLSGLHDADAGRDALPRVLARAHEGQDDPLRAPSAPQMTQALIAINVLVFIAESAGGAPLGGGGGGTIYNHGALFGPLIAHQHEYWRLVTSGFLHDGLAHLFVNMLFLYFIGMMLEPAIGSVNFAAIYFTSLLGRLVRGAAVPADGAHGRRVRARSSGSSAR